MAIDIKTDKQIQIMAEGGKILSAIRKKLVSKVAAGVSAMDIEDLAMDLIKKAGAEPSFTRVKDYKWATCISVNEQLVHGIPKKDTVFKRGDLVSIDVGVLYKGFNTDTSVTVGIDIDPQKQKFLEVGRRALNLAIKEARIGKYIYDISKAMETTLKNANFSPIRALVGHGVGKILHEDPQIPCFVPGDIKKSPRIVEGMVLAIEVMYALGSSDVELLEDGWTIGMRDGKISALFEETVAVTKSGPKVLT